MKKIGGKMKKILFLILVFLLVFSLSFVKARDFDVKEKEDIKKELKFTGTAKQKQLKVDNIFGFIEVEGYNGKVVKLEVKKTILAETKAKLMEAKKEVKLEITEKGDLIELYVDGPFRCKKKGRVYMDIDDLGYIVKYDFKLKVPKHTNLKVGTINDGEIKVRDIVGKCQVSNVNDYIEATNIAGDFNIRTVNGKITIKGVTGSGKAHTVNGAVKVHFDKNPQKDCSFKTINGNLELTFQKGLSADFQVKTFNGDVYTDCEAIYLPSTPTKAKGKRKKGKYVYKSNRSQGLRIGKNGPGIKMDTLNGNIIIAEKK
jgi:hypothetical protein